MLKQSEFHLPGDFKQRFQRHISGSRYNEMLCERWDWRWVKPEWCLWRVTVRTCLPKANSLHHLVVEFCLIHWTLGPQREGLTAAQVGKRGVEIRQNWEGEWYRGKATDFRVGKTWVRCFLHGSLCNVGKILRNYCFQWTTIVLRSV